MGYRGLDFRPDLTASDPPPRPPGLLDGIAGWLLLLLKGRP